MEGDAAAAAAAFNPPSPPRAQMEGDGASAVNPPSSPHAQMEIEGSASASASAVNLPSPPHDPELSPVESPGIADPLLEGGGVTQPSDDHHHSCETLTDDLRDKIIKQVEYYFSDENLPTDQFLMKYVNKDKDGFVPIPVIASFRKMKKLIQDRSLIVAALRQSSLLVVSSSGKKVRRLHPLPLFELKDPKLSSVLVENLPEDRSTENIQRIFGEAGNIKNISFHDPHAAYEPKKCTITEKLLSGKLYALVEYETVEAAEKAVATLNNEQNWRYGMRVKLLKQSGKHAEKKKGWREADSEKNSHVQFSDSAVDLPNHHSSEHHEDTLVEEDEGHLAREKNDYKGRNLGRGRRQKYHGTNGHGHGTVSSSLGSETLKPPPGPAMPDGTRGFTMGRGRPLSSNPN